jgi:hypothetical protein
MPSASAYTSLHVVEQALLLAASLVVLAIPFTESHR